MFSYPGLIDIQCFRSLSVCSYFEEFSAKYIVFGCRFFSFWLKDYLDLEPEEQVLNYTGSGNNLESYFAQLLIFLLLV